MTMKYISTRGGCPPQNFEQVLLSGLALDGGLFIPQTLPTFSAEQIEAMKSLQYADLALEIVTPFVDGEIPTSQLKKVIDESYAALAIPRPRLPPRIQYIRRTPKTRTQPDC